MITTKELKTMEDFEQIKKGDVLACEFNSEISDYPKKYKFNVFKVHDNLHDMNELILQKKNNIYFNYKMFCVGTSGLKQAILIQNKEAPQENME